MQYEKRDFTASVKSQDIRDQWCLFVFLNRFVNLIGNFHRYVAEI